MQAQAARNSTPERQLPPLPPHRASPITPEGHGVPAIIPGPLPLKNAHRDGEGWIQEFRGFHCPGRMQEKFPTILTLTDNNTVIQNSARPTRSPQ